MRQPVLFQKPVETSFTHDPCPRGGAGDRSSPHAGWAVHADGQRAGQVGRVDTVGAQPVRAVLHRRNAFVSTLVGMLCERGVEVSLKGHYAGLGYRLATDLPKHPYIKKSIRDLKLVLFEEESNASSLRAGPAAGGQRFGGEQFVVEMGDRTFSRA